MIVSAVQGAPDVIIDGQVALTEIGRRNGVRRILPSDARRPLGRLASESFLARGRPNGPVRIPVSPEDCWYSMLTGQAALSDPQNDRYPDLELEGFTQFAARMLPRQVAA